MEYDDMSEGNDEDINKVEEAALKYMTKMTPMEYVDWEDQQERRYEYVDGEIIPVEACSLSHNRIVSRIVTKIGLYLDGKQCEILPSNLRISEKTMDSYFYPDASIFCGDPDKKENAGETYKNPSVIFEILSPSTATYDLGRKLFFYMQIESLKEYIAIDSRKIEVHIRRKQENGIWKYNALDNINNILVIESIGMSLSLADIYEKITF